MKKSPFHRLLTLLHCALIPSILAVGGFCSVVLPKPTVSDYERRELAKFPEFSLEALFSGSFTGELELFYADTFPLRESLVKLGAQLEDLRGVRMDDIRIHETGPASQDTAVPPSAIPPSGEAAIPGTDVLPVPSFSESAASSQASESVQSSAPPVQPADDPNAPAPEQYNSVLVYQNRAMAPFGGSEAMGGYYASVLSQYQEKLGNEMTIYNLLVPTSVEFYLPDKYKSVTNSQKASIDYIYSQLDPRIRRVDAYSALAQHTDEYLYFATDHHWTALGAYYAYEEICKSLNMQPAPLSAFEEWDQGTFEGSLYWSCNQSSRLELDNVIAYNPPGNLEMWITNSDGGTFEWDVLTDMSYSDESSKYMTFIAGDNPMTEIINHDLPDGPTCVLVKDSFGNPLAPFLTQNYHKIYVMDFRKYDAMNLRYFVENYDVDHIIFGHMLGMSQAEGANSLFGWLCG